MKNDLRLMLVPTTFMFWVSFLPVPEWCCCNAGLGQFPALCPPDGLLLLLLFFLLVVPPKKEKKREENVKSQKNLKTHNQLIKNPLKTIKID